MLFIYASDKLLASTYADLLKNFDPFFSSQKEDVLSKLHGINILLIDEDSSFTHLIQKKAPQLSILLLTSTPEQFKQAPYTILKKPLSIHALRSKITFLKTLSEKGLTSCFQTSFYNFDASSRSLFLFDQKTELHLTEKETEIIQYLYQNKNRIVPKEELLEKIFGYKTGVETHTLETHIYKLRQKIGLADDQSFISTSEGGYQLKIS